MIAPLSLLLIAGSAAFSSARPLALRAVTSLDQAATAEAQQRDDTAARAFTAQPIKTSDGKCFSVDPLSGDFRENLTPVQLVDCDGSDGQKWDVITAGKHNNVPGAALIVSSLTNACLNFDPRRAAGNQVLLFSCGGRADGGGEVTDSQLFAFDGSAGPLTLQPRNSAGTCLTSANGNLLDQASCDNSPAQTFTIGDGNAAGGSSGSTPSSDPAPSSSASEATSSATITASPSVNNDAAVASTNPTPTGPIPVSRAGNFLNPSAAAEANVRDDTATRAFSDVSLKSADGRCLFIDQTAGDFRENLIPVQLKDCDGSANEKFDLITAGKHNNAPNSMIVVSTLTQGCLNFDPRRAAGDTVIMFSCGGRAGGEGLTTDSQLFPFTGEKSIVLAPENAKNATCLVPNGAKLDQANCSGGADQLFTIV